MFFFFSSRRRHTRLQGDWSSDVCSSDLVEISFVLHGIRPEFWRGYTAIPEGAIRSPRRVQGLSVRWWSIEGSAQAKPCLERHFWYVHPVGKMRLYRIETELASWLATARSRFPPR